MRIKYLTLFLTIMMAVALAACGGTADTAPVQEEQTEAEPQEESGLEAETADVVSYTNDGLILNIPAEYDSLVQVTTTDENGDGTCFSVSELASLEWGEKLHPGEDWGDGWLFGIGRIDEDALHEMLCYDMSGAIPFASDENGSYFVFYHPTDVRFVRESYDIDPDNPDWEQWGELNEWAWTMQDTFAADNSLTLCRFTNTSADMCLAQVAYMDEPYTLTALDYGTLTPDGLDVSFFPDMLLDGVTFEMVDNSQRPDGEYIILELPQTGEQLEFFLADGNYVREVYDGEETLYQASYSDGGTDTAMVARQWYDTLAEAAGMG